jgi:hypothetical protein
MKTLTLIFLLLLVAGCTEKETEESKSYRPWVDSCVVEINKCIVDRNKIMDNHLKVDEYQIKAARAIGRAEGSGDDRYRKLAKIYLDSADQYMNRY